MAPALALALYRGAAWGIMAESRSREGIAAGKRWQWMSKPGGEPLRK